MINTINPDFSDVPGRRGKFSLYRHFESDENKSVDVSVLTLYDDTTEDFVVETFVSLQNQSLQNWEWIIVVNDNSDEVALALLKRFVESDRRVFLVSLVNGGPSAARNTAFNHSSGRYLCLLDNADMLEPTYLEKCVWFLESNQEFSFCNSWSVLFGNQESLCDSGFEMGEDFIRANIGASIPVIRRNAYEECGGFNESISCGYEDWDFWLAMATAGHWGYTLPEFLLWHRQSAIDWLEQTIQSTNKNTEFKKYIHRKYRRLAGRFPTPQRRPPQSFEAINTDVSLANPLAKSTSSKRIMFILPWMVTGGADRVNLDLVSGLVEQGYEVTVCATLDTDHNWKYRFADLTPDVFVLPEFLHLYDYPRFLSYLIDSRKIDTVVITGSTIGYLLLPYLRSTAPSVSFVDICHVEEPLWMNGGHPRFAVGYQDILDLNIVTTARLSGWMEKRGADQSMIKVLYTGVEVPESTEIAGERRKVRAELGIPADLPVIIFAGRICPQKRPEVLAEILRATRDTGLAFQALIIGDGEQRAMLANLIKKYHLNNCVSMLGTVSHERWLSLLAASDVFLLPSAYEGISVALLEAMAAGVVPVVSRVGGQAELVEDGAGFLVSHGDDECARYVEALGLLLAGDEQRREFSLKSRALISQRFSRLVTSQNFVAILGESMRLSSSDPHQMVTPGFARELASFAMEYTRLSNSPNCLTGHIYNTNMSLTSMALRKSLLILKKSRFSKIILKNKLLGALGRNILAKLKDKMTIVE